MQPSQQTDYQGRPYDTRQTDYQGRPYDAKETDPLSTPPVISVEVQQARSLALLVLIVSAISMIADTVLAALVGGPWGAGGVIGALGASLVLCCGPRHGHEGNVTYSFFMLAMLAAMVFHAFQLYATVVFWQLWVRPRPTRPAPASAHGRVRLCTAWPGLPEPAEGPRSDDTSRPGFLGATQAPRWHPSPSPLPVAEGGVWGGDEHRGVAGDRRQARPRRVHARELHLHHFLLDMPVHRAAGAPARRPSA